jgi:hypothetical protein
VTTTGEAPSEVLLTLAPSASLSGTVAVEQGGPKLSNIWISARPADGRPRFSGVEPMTTPDASGRFVLRGLTPGRYWLSTNAGAGWVARLYVKDSELPGPIQIGRESIGDATIRITPELPAVIQGTLTTADERPDLVHAVILLAEDERFWDASCVWIRAAQASTKGRFRFDDLKAGRYRVVVTEPRRPDCGDPAALRDLARNGMAIEVAAGETRQIALRSTR